jgi:predicted transcriptional regulator
MKASELKAWREQLGMTQLKFARFLRPERTPSIVSAWESGRTKIPEYVDVQRELHEARILIEQLKR